VVAALNTSMRASRRSMEVVREAFLPALLEIASELRPLLV
jgi:hypothetical protein